MLPLKMLGLMLFSALPYDMPTCNAIIPPEGSGNATISVSRGADLTCTQMRDSLILDTPEIIQYGTEVSANCSTTEEEFEEMTLQLGNTTCKSSQQNATVSCVAPVFGLEMTAVCKIRLNDTLECSKKVEITVYKILLSVKTGDIGEADYELQCDVVSVATVQNLTVTWYKNNEECTTEACIEAGGERDSISSMLPVNIGREEISAGFRCEVQLNLGQESPQHPLVSATHYVSARYAPELRTNSSTSITLPKGGNATLLCDVEGNPPPEYRWTIDEELQLETTNKLEITGVNSRSTYSCTATNILGNITVRIHVDVEEVTTTTGPTAQPVTEAKEPENCGLTLTPSEVYVKYGDPASIICSTTSKEFGLIDWENAVGTKNKTPSTVTWKVEKLEDFTVEPFCYVTMTDNNQCIKYPNITLYKLPDLVEVLAAGDGSVTEGKEHQLQCNMNRVAPVDRLLVKWYKDEELVLTDDQNSFSVTSLDGHLCDITSVYNFTAKKSDNGALFTCKAEFQFGPAGPPVPPSMASEPHTAVVHYKPTMKACPARYLGEENELRLHDVSCEADGNPPPTITWYHNGAQVNPSTPLQRNDSGTYKATVVNSVGQIETDVHITVEYRPSFTCQMRYEVKVNDTVKTLCEPEGLPRPSIHWLQNGKQILPQRWKKHESGNYSVKASNKYGTAEHEFYLDILYPPEFTGLKRQVLFSADKNVSLVCQAGGNPEPEIRWEYQLADNVDWTTTGRQKIITITRATSANTGSYKCIATNKVGKVTGTVTLEERAEPRHSFVNLWWLLPVVGLLFILAIVLLVKRQKKLGQYDVVANNDKNIPLQSVENGTC
ncbi:hemicentin-1 [Fundulus diaphanus]